MALAENGIGPPREVGPRPGHHSRTEDTDTTTSHLDSADAYILGLRRRAASRRMVPLDCGCPTGPHADPLSCLCTSPPLSEHALDSWRDAAEHVLAGGQMPVVPLEVRRALYRRGGRDRALAARLHRGCGGRAA